MHYINAAKCSFIILIIIVFASCKKHCNNDGIDYGQGTGRCRISSYDRYDVNSGTPRITTISYDELGRISQVVNPDVFQNTTLKYVYKNGCILIEHPDSNGFVGGYDSIVLDAQSRVVSTYNVYVQPPFVNPGWGFYYTSTGGIFKQQALEDSTTATYYRYMTGDRTRDSLRRNNYFDYTYFTDKPFQYASGDALYQYFKYGHVVAASAHLLKGGISNDSRLAYRLGYAFDQDGKVVADTLILLPSQQVSEVRVFHYDCN